MYDQFYGLKGRPFQLTPDPHFYFESATHRKALSYLGYGLAQGEGFIVITGDIGAGKTTLVAHLMATIDPSRLTAVKIVSTQVEGDDMLRLVVQAFGLAAHASDKAQLLKSVEAHLHAEARAGRRCLLIVDEAQNLPTCALEELRMLSNFQLGGQALLQIFLLGQPEFRDQLRSPELEQLRQRVIATHHLEPMMAEEVEPYIVHRLSLVGWQGRPHIASETYAAIFEATGGVPRRINVLASRILLLGAVDRLETIDASVVDAVLHDMASDDVAPPPAPAVPVAPLASLEPQATTADTVPHEGLATLQGEVADIREAVLLLHQDVSAQADLPKRMAELEERVAIAEARAREQDAALRRVLTLLVDWVERDEPYETRHRGAA